MFANHTPGPWHVSGDQIRGSAHPESPDLYEPVATIEPIRRKGVTAGGDAVRRFDQETAKANAALIAAAPDLLAALITLRQAVDHAVDRGLLEEAPLDPRTALDAQEWMRGQLGSATRHAREAVARATGGAHGQTAPTRRHERETDR